MLDSKGFDLWADGYDKDVGLSEEENSYPFAGYKAVLNAIYNRVLTAGAKKVLDIGFGTGTLTTRLYDAGCAIYGQDFSSEMLALAQAKMPRAELFLGDLTQGIVAPLQEERYDAILATYSLHHLEVEQKVTLLQSLLALLNEGGTIYIGDVAFATAEEQKACQREAGEAWDPDEFYWVHEELKEALPCLTFEKFSHCAGLLTLTLQVERRGFYSLDKHAF